VIINNCRHELSKIISPQDVILDIGCCYGESKKYFPENKIIGYDAINSLETQLDEFYRMAVVNEENRREVPFVINDNARLGKIGVSNTTVPAISFGEVLERHSDVTVLKIDVEGYERHYDYKLIPPPIRIMCIEWHYKNEVVELEGFDIAYKKINALDTVFNIDVIYRRKK